MIYYLSVVSDGCYDYAIPEAGTIPLLSPEHTLPRPHINSVGSDISRVTSKSSKTDGKKVSTLLHTNIKRMILYNFLSSPLLIFLLTHFSFSVIFN